MDNETNDETTSWPRLLVLFLTIFALPGLIILGGSLLLVAIGVDSHRALSLAGLTAVSVAAVWGAIIALTGIDNRIAGRAKPGVD